MLRTVYRWVIKIFRSDAFAEQLLFFREVSLFHGLSTRQLGRLMQAMQKRNYRLGENLFSEGQIGKAVFVIESGRVELARRAVDGSKRTLGVLGRGQIFGEMALLEQMERTATATVIEDGVIHLLYTSTLDALMKQYPYIGMKLMRNMATMLSGLLRRTNQEMDHRTKVAHE